MPVTSEIDITIGGLLLFCFSEDEKTCNVKVNTAADGHALKIIVEEGDQVSTYLFNKERVKALHPLSFAVTDLETGRPIPNSASKGVDYGSIPDLEGPDFYGRRLNIASQHYETSIFLNHGTVDGGDVALGCFRVKEKHFEDLNFRNTTLNMWEGFVANAQQRDADSIKPIGIAREASVKITLSEGQVLRLRHGSEETNLFEPLRHGTNYKVTLTYDDQKPPTSLTECIGFAHHCRAAQLQSDEAIYGLFRIVFDDPESTQGSTDPGCCILAQIQP